MAAVWASVRPLSVKVVAAKRVAPRVPVRPLIPTPPVTLSVRREDAGGRRPGPPNDGANVPTPRPAAVTGALLRRRANTQLAVRLVPVALAASIALPPVRSLALRAQERVVGGRADGLNTVPAAHGRRLGPVLGTRPPQRNAPTVRVYGLRPRLKRRLTLAGARDAGNSRDVFQTPCLKPAAQGERPARTARKRLEVNALPGHAQNKKPVVACLDGPTARLVVADGEGPGGEAGP